MNQQEILEYNKRCAEFLGGLYSKHAEAWGFGNAKNIGSKMFHGVMYQDVIQAERFEKELKFHSDWNWIMEVVEAIEIKYSKYTLQWEYDNREEFAENGKYKAYWFTLRPKDEICTGLSDLRSKTRKEAVVQAINQFLIWYKEQS